MVTAFRLSRFVNAWKDAGASPADRATVETTMRERHLYAGYGTAGKKKIIRVPDMDEELEAFFAYMREAF